MMSCFDVSSRHTRGRMGFFERPTDRVVAGALDDLQFDDLLLQKTQGPFGAARRSRPASQSDQLGFRFAVENPPPGGIGIGLARQDGLEAFLDKEPSRPLDRRDAGVQSLGDPAVAPSVAGLRDVRFQQNAGSRRQMRGALALADKLLEPSPFLPTQPDHVFLDGNLCAGHESISIARSRQHRFRQCQQKQSREPLVVPAGVPVHFSLTSASVMSAFFVPRLGSMIYTMNGMTTQLNLRADAPGDFLGEASHFSGDGFSDMHFEVKAEPADQFATWIAAARNAGPTLDAASYVALARQSVERRPFTFGSVESGLFQKIVTLQLPPGPGPQQADLFDPSIGLIDPHICSP